MTNAVISKDYVTTKDVVEMLKEEGANDQEITKILKTYHNHRKENEVININPSKKISEAATDLESKILGLQEHLKEDNFKTTARVHSDSDNLEKDLYYQITIKKNESIIINVSSKEDNGQIKREDKLYTLKIELNSEIEKPKSKVRELTDHPLHKYSIYGHLGFAGVMGLINPILGASTFAITYGLFSRGVWDSVDSHEYIQLHKENSENRFSMYKPTKRQIRNAKLHDHFVRPFKLISYHTRKLYQNTFKQQPKLIFEPNQRGELNTSKDYLNRLRRKNVDDPQRAKLITKSLSLLPKTVNYELGKSTQFLDDLN